MSATQSMTVTKATPSTASSMAASDEDIVNTSSFVKDCIHQLFTIQGRSTAGLGESVPLKTSKDSVALIHRFISESGEAIKTNLSEIKIGGQPGLFPGLCRMTTTEEDAVWQMRIYVNAAIESGSPAAALLSTLAATHMFICNAIARDCVRVVPGLLRGAAIALAESKLVELAKQQGGWAALLSKDAKPTSPPTRWVDVPVIGSILRFVRLNI